MSLITTLLSIGTGAIEKGEEAAIETGLQSLHDSEPDVWARIVDDLQFASTKLAGHVKGKLPSALIEGIGIAAKESQDDNPGPAQTGDTTAGGQ